MGKDKFVVVYNATDDDYLYVNVANIAWFYSNPPLIGTADGVQIETKEPSIDRVKEAIEILGGENIEY